MRIDAARALALATATLVVLASLSACSDDPATPAPISTPVRSTSAPSAEPATSETSAAEPPVRNDLSKLPLRRTIEAGNLTIRAEYDTRLPPEEWRATLPKPLHVTITAVNRRKSGQKIFLMRTTATVTASNESGVIESPPVVTDEADISPGFIITSPNTYNQTLILPAVDTSTTSLAVDLTYELVQEVARDELGVRDFAKQVADDTVVIPVLE